MKTKLIFLITVLALLFIPKQNFAETTRYFTIYMDSVQNNDTVAVCNSFDSVKLVGMHGLTQGCWIYTTNTNPCNDTLYSDTLCVKWDYSSMLSYQGFDGTNWQAKWIWFGSLNIYLTQDFGYYQYYSCNSNSQLNAVTNYKGGGHYSWLPIAGLSNPEIADPVATVTGNKKYTLTFTTTEGCSIKDSIDIVIQPMQATSICIVSVDSNAKNQIIWEKPATQLIDSFYIYKETNVTNDYIKIGNVGYNSYNVFTDTASYPEVQSNRYLISFKDVCGLESFKSYTHKTMHLSVNKGQNESWNLIWEPYEGFIVTSYNIFRGSTANDLKLIGSTAGSGATQFSDLTPPTGELFYQVEVISPNDCILSGSNSKSAATYASSRSNIADNKLTDIHKIETNPFHVYPNPANEQLFVVLEQQGQINSTLEIYDLRGKLVQTYNLNPNETAVNISGLNKGCYMLKLKTESGSFNQLVIKN